jgi:hypothetical protein
MVKGIIFYGSKGSVKIYSENQKVYESLRIYENDLLSKNFCPIKSFASLSGEIGFNCLDNFLTKYFLENKNIEIQSNIGTSRLIRTINYVLEHLKNSNLNTFYKYKIIFEFDMTMSCEMIKKKVVLLSKKAKRINYTVPTYQGKRLYDQDEVKKFEVTIEL